MNERSVMRARADACLALRRHAHRYLRDGDLGNFRRCIAMARGSLGWHQVKSDWRRVFEKENVNG